MRLRLLTAALAVACFGVYAEAQFFSETFDDGNAAGRWSAPIVDGETGLFDGTVDLAFDYSTLGVPPAPNSGGTTTGLFMEVNVVDDGPVGEGESVGVVSNLATIPSGDFKFLADVWYEVDFSTGGSTEYGGFSVFATGPNFPGDAGFQDDVPFRSFGDDETDPSAPVSFEGSNGDGLTFALTGDGGASDDIFVFSDSGNDDDDAEGLPLSLGSLDSIPFGDIPGVVTGAGDPNDLLGVNGFGPTTGGWVEIAIESVGGLISFTLNGFELATFDNTSGIHTGGSIMLSYSDAFNSSQDTGPGGLAHFILFDNVRLVPEPTSAVLGLLAAAGFAVARRR